MGYLVFAFKQFAYWLLYFICLQALFLVFFASQLNDVAWTHILYSFKSGFGLNLSATAYCVLLIVLTVYISSFFKREKPRLLVITSSSLIFITAFIYFADFALFHNWGTKINGKALWYLQFPGTVSSSASNTGHLVYLFGVLQVTVPFWFFYRRYLTTLPSLQNQPIKNTVLFLMLAAILFVTLRGGLGGRPISKAQSYYSQHAALNYAAVNGFWNFFDIISHYKPQGNPYHFFSEQELVSQNTKFQRLKSKAAERLTEVDQPNILFVYLESWGADVVGCLGGEQGVTPYFDQLIKEGVLFDQFYSTGFRTEQGLMATLSGFPAQAQAYPMEEMERFENYPNLISILKKRGYYTSYFTGGNPDFANTSVYLKSAGIDKINQDLLANAKRRSAWGALDEETFDWALNKLNQQKQPFFSSVVTLTSHEWFEAPVKKVFTGKDEVSDNYKNTVHYTDSCLFDFMSKLEKQSWYKNTLVIVMSDHACNYPLNRSMSDPLRYRIPFLICGGALKDKWKNTRVPSSKGHLNVPATVLNELNLSNTSFTLSLPLTDTTAMAYFTYDHGFGLIKNQGVLVYDCNQKKNIIEINAARNTDLLNLGFYMMQYSAQMKENYKTKKQ